MAHSLAVVLPLVFHRHPDSQQPKRKHPTLVLVEHDGDRDQQRRPEFAAAKPDFIKRFEKWIPDKLKHQSTQLAPGARDKDPIPILISLYSCDPNAVESLAQCRINPDMSAPVRKDLEFFIPQLCSFYLQGYYDNMQ